MTRDTDLEAPLVAKFVVMAPVLDERGRRLWAAAESAALGTAATLSCRPRPGCRGTTIRGWATGVGRRRDARRHAFAGRAPGAPGLNRPSRASRRRWSCWSSRDARRSDVAVALDLQEYRKLRRR